MITDNIVNCTEKLYNSILIIKNKIQEGGSNNEFSICEAIADTFTNINTNKLKNFRDNVNSKIFKDRIKNCIRKHADDTDNINSLRFAICNNNIYNTIKNFYKLPNNINEISELLYLISIIISAIFAMNFSIIFIYIMKENDKIPILIMFLLLSLIAFLILFLSL